MASALLVRSSQVEVAVLAGRALMEQPASAAAAESACYPACQRRRDISVLAVGLAVTRFPVRRHLLLLVGKTAAAVARAQVVLEPQEMRVPAAVVVEGALVERHRETVATAALESSSGAGMPRRQSPRSRLD